MPLQHTPEHEARATAGVTPPPLPAIDPPVGSESLSPIPAGAAMQAQVLIHQAGSAELAKEAVDGAAARESVPDFREDSFAQRFGFATRIELLEASTPLISADGTPWWATAIADNRWIVWNQNNMTAAKTFATLQEARSSIYPRI